MRRILLLVAVLAVATWAEKEDSAESVSPVPFVEPKIPDDAILVETFQGKNLSDSGWVASKNEKYHGEFTIASGETASIPDDTGLFVPAKANHYAISRKIEPLDLEMHDLVIQYQFRYDDYPTCGGAYMKLFASPFEKLAELDNSVPYSIMFGPDRCGADAKVHFIFQHKNEKSGKLVEHHMKDPPSPASDKSTHLYTLAVFKNMTFAVYVDNQKERGGSLFEEFEPPLQAPEQILDPNDTKPADWVDKKKIKDPNATKPDDWDEDEPQLIEDPEAKKPDDWLDDEPLLIPDPQSTKPDDWDEKEDGEWVAEDIDNPKCENRGCGEWVHPMIDNPKFKGKWKAPMIDNPDYKGKWVQKTIPNPDYYKVDKAHLLPISAVGFEIWTMDAGYTFDNVLISESLDVAKAFAAETYDRVREAEKEREDRDIEEMAKKENFYDDEEGVDIEGAGDEATFEESDEDKEIYGSEFDDEELPDDEDDYSEDDYDYEGEGAEEPLNDDYDEDEEYEDEEYEDEEYEAEDEGYAEEEL
eukprot:CAMPEP_0113958286 /NCGR_PEP_ID=MMETSP0011_2-20120614/3304_1 /TAXON_ID=101924 /ORGANISM="Rhodosorus marinus" /LENGTH=527 /DNA_ID=CAMNT_0000969069 /DNA_START=98 /DNA_END=1681 /DNA_ORIENTATION=- /assembly_acc=CAM_ASM_000156